MLAGEKSARTAEARGHLVGDQQHVVPVGQLPNGSEETARVGQYPAGPLDEGFDDHGAILARGVGEYFFDLIQNDPPRFGPGWVMIRIGRIDESRLEQQRAKYLAKRIDTAK